MNTKYIILLLLLLSFSGCDNPVEQDISKLQVSFKNNSPFELVNLNVADKVVGNLPGNASSTYIPFDNFTFDTGLPDEDASAIANTNVLTNFYRGYWCGTEKITIDSGKYLIEINVEDTVLFLSCKNAPRIDFP